MIEQKQTETQLEYIDELIAEGVDIWETLIGVGIASEDDADERRWFVGDLALRVEKCYGEDRLASFAKAINVSVKTIYERRQMSGFYENSARQNFDNIRYRHYREAMRLETPERAMCALEKASARGWTIERMGMILSRFLRGRQDEPPPKPSDTEKVVDNELHVVSVRGVRASFDFSPDAAQKLIEEMSEGRPVRVVIHRQRKEDQA